MVFFSTRLAVCVVWLGQGYWMIRHISNVIITFFSLCLYGCGYSLLTEDSLINTLTLHVLMIVLDPHTEVIWGTILDTYLACQGLTIPGEVTLGYHHCLGKLLHLNLLHSSVVVCGPDGERCWMSQGPCHTEGESLGLGQLGLSVYCRYMCLIPSATQRLFRSWSALPLFPDFMAKIAWDVSLVV